MNRLEPKAPTGRRTPNSLDGKDKSILATPLYDKAQVLGEQNNDPNAAVYKANYERANAKLKETQATKKQ